MDRREVPDVERLRRRHRAALTKDTLLTNVTLYWVTGAINSSFWPYYARFPSPVALPDGQRISVPTAYAASRARSCCRRARGRARLQHPALDR